jgi:molybdenum cofactor cytidylyltransferase
MITAIVLAAGESKRMGAQKALLAYGETSVIEHIVAALDDGGVDDVIVVTGFQPDRIANVLSGGRARTAFNPNYAEGMLSSVRCGLRTAAPESDAFLIALGDQPSIRLGVVKAIVDEFKKRSVAGDFILVPAYDGRRGHPMLFSAAFRQDVLTRFDDVGLRGLLAAHPEAVQELPADSDAVLRDMDNPTDYASELDALDESRRST